MAYNRHDNKQRWQDFILALTCLCILVCYAEGSTANCTANADTVIQYTVSPTNYTRAFIMRVNSSIATYPNMTCGWNVTAPEGYVVLIYASIVRWESGNESCADEYTQVYDGPNAASVTLDNRYCRTLSSSSSSLLSTGRTAYVETRSGNTSSSGRIFVIMFLFEAVKHEACSYEQNLTASSSVLGNLSSPYYDLSRENRLISYPRNLNCSWRIKAPPGHLVKVITQGVNVGCDTGNDTFKIYDGYSAKDNIALRSKCHTSIQDKYGETVYTSSDEYMVIQFTSDDKIKQDVWGFKITYTAVLPDYKSGNIVTVAANTTEETLRSPIYRYQDRLAYPLNVNITWHLKAPPGHVIKLFVYVDVNCPADTLTIYDGNRTDNTILDYGFPCGGGRTLRKTFYTISDNVFLRLESDATRDPTFFGFMIKYTAVVPVTTCLPGQTETQNLNLMPLASSGDVISSPQTSPLKFTCVWKLLAPPNHVIKLSFDPTIFGSKYSAELYVRNGVLGEGADVANYNSYKFLKMLSPHYLYTTSRMAEISFEARNVVNRAPGFLVNYTYEALDTSTSGSCEANSSGVIYLEGQGASVISPGMKASARGFLPRNMTCVWNITVERGYRIEITFKYYQMDCAHDSVKFYSGPIRSSQAMKSLCGSFDYSSARPVYATSNTLLVYLTTGTLASIGRDLGFSVIFRAVKTVPAPYACWGDRGFSYTDLNPAAAGNNITIASYGYPNLSPNLAYCKWSVTPPFAKRLRFSFNTLDLEEPANKSDCSEKDDFINVRIDYDNRRLCGRPVTLPVIKAAQRDIAITFKTNKEGRSKGFEANIVTESDPSFGNCTIQGQDNEILLSGDSGVLFSPKYPSSYPKNMMCTWIITIPEGKKIRMRFTPFYLDSKCRSYLEIRQGGTPDSKLVGRYCGWKDPPELFSSGEKLWVRFHSSKDYDGGSRFYATYETVNTEPLSIACRQSNTIFSTKLEGSPTGALASYNYPLLYENDVTCMWQISVSNLRRIKLTFDSFDLEKSDGCLSDYVEIRDGYSFKDLLGRFCGSSKPPPVYSSEELMWIKFKTNGTGRYGGFKASFETEISVTARILIIVGSVLGGLFILSFIVFSFRQSIVKCCCKRSNAQTIPDGASVAGSNFALTTMK